MKIIEIAVENKDIQLKLKANVYSLLQLISKSENIIPVFKLDDGESGIKIEIPLDQIVWLQNTKAPE